MNKDSLIQDLAPFCDIGSSPKVSEKDGKQSVKLSRDGRQVSLIFDSEGGRVQATFGGGQKKYFSSLSNLLASDGFANLRRWSDLQREYLRSTSVAGADLIPFQGRTHDGKLLESVEAVDSLLGGDRPTESSTEILLLDGPAGVGKTTLIEQIGLRRAESYKISGNPLVLHVKSRGRVLSNLQDLMAFSLQTLRLSITYDQIPVLVRHGLVVLAIDGFDELGDPNGYQLAWAQVNEIVTSVRGHGSIILAGRDTFIGRDRLLRDVKSLRSNVDVVNEVALDSPLPDQARAWLKRTGQWNDASLAQPVISVLLEPGSYALRPVFLRLIRDQVKAREIKAKSENDLTSFLVGHMIDREAGKFGDVVERVLTPQKLREFIFDFLVEVARDMADSQAESVDSVALTWIAEASLGSGYPDEVVAMIKNRVGVVAFLADDDRPGHKKFSHAQIMNFFLASAAFRAISSGDIPKFIRRNLLGVDLLKAFGELTVSKVSTDEGASEYFFQEAAKFAKTHSQVDRATRNLGALLLAASPSIQPAGRKSIGGFQVDDAVVRGTVPPCLFHNMVIKQFDVRGADLSGVDFDSCSILQLISDEGSRLSPTFPNVDAVLIPSGSNLTDQDVVISWLDAQGRKPANGISAVDKLETHPAYKLLGKACRLRQYWLRSEGDHHATRILNDQWWPTLERALRKHDLLREEVDRQASGRSSTFYHIRQADRLLKQERNDHEVMQFFEDLLDMTKK